MQHVYTIQAIRLGKRKRVYCTSARQVVEQMESLARRGWNVIVSDSTGLPIDDTSLKARSIAEALVLIEHARAARLRASAEFEIAI